MKNTIIFLLLLQSIGLPSLGQTFSGKVIDAKTQEPVPYVNIGIVKKGIGTVSDEKGSFKLTIDDQYNSDTLRLSMIGYEPQRFLVSDFKKQFSQQEAIVVMKPAITELKEVTVKPGKIKYAELGNDFHSKTVTAGFTSNKLGSEVGVVMRIKKAPTYIEKVTFHIAANKYDSAIWRVNIYLLKDGKPSENILKQAIYLKSYKSYETLSLDLSKYLIEVDSDFVVALELIQDLGEKGLMFCAGLFGNSIFARKASQGEWTNLPVGVGFSATVSYGY
jgi:hypothetical protein